TVGMCELGGKSANNCRVGAAMNPLTYRNRIVLGRHLSRLIFPRTVDPEQINIRPAGKRRHGLARQLGPVAGGDGNRDFGHVATFLIGTTLAPCSTTNSGC